MNNHSLAVIILTYNEEKHIERAINSVKSIANEIFVIDSGSTDNTRSIAQQQGASILHHDFVNQAQQFNWALDNAPITADWIMRLDADEIIETDLQQEILTRLPVLPASVSGINLKRKHIFMDRWVRYGGRYPLVMLRIWRTGYGRVEDRWMDEHVLITSGETVTFDGGFADHNLHDLTFFTDKHNKYATREAIDVLNKRFELFPQNKALNAHSASFQASCKRQIKEKVYNRIPFTISALLYFLWRYIFQLGFLDGRSGLVYHFLQGFWYRFLVGAKIMELEKAIVDKTDKQEIIATLSDLTGYKLAEHQ